MEDAEVRACSRLEEEQQRLDWSNFAVEEILAAWKRDHGLDVWIGEGVDLTLKVSTKVAGRKLLDAIQVLARMIGCRVAVSTDARIWIVAEGRHAPGELDLSQEPESPEERAARALLEQSRFERISRELAKARDFRTRLVRIEAHDRPLEEILQLITDESNVPFERDKERLKAEDLERRVTLVGGGRQLEVVLKELLDPLNLGADYSEAVKITTRALSSRSAIKSQATEKIVAAWSGSRDRFLSSLVAISGTDLRIRDVASQIAAQTGFAIQLDEATSWSPSVWESDGLRQSVRDVLTSLCKETPLIWSVQGWTESLLAHTNEKPSKQDTVLFHWPPGK